MRLLKYGERQPSTDLLKWYNENVYAVKNYDLPRTC